MLGEAERRGVPTVVVDRGRAEILPHVSFVTCDDRTIGDITARWLAERLRGRGSLLLLPGLIEAEPAHRRLEGARAVFARYPGLRILDVCWTGWRHERGREIVAAKLADRCEPIDGVWCDSGLQAVGSLRAYLAAGRSGAVPPHTGGDLNLAYKLAIRHGVAQAAVDYPPAMGLRSVEVLIEVLRGRSVPRRVEVPTEIVVTRGDATRSVRPDLWSDEHVRWDLPDDLILASGLGPSYDPRSYRVHYKGNRYNRSAADRAARSSHARRMKRLASRRSRSFSRASPRRRGARSRRLPPNSGSGARQPFPLRRSSTLRDSWSAMRAAACIPARSRRNSSLPATALGGWRIRPETLLPVLRDDTDASASLFVSDKERAFLVVRRRAAWDAGSESGSRRIEAPVGRSPSGFAARLSLVLRPKASEAGARFAAACMGHVAAALAKTLEGKDGR